MNAFKIGNTDVYSGCRPLIIAEIGQNHDGSLGIAHSYIDAVAKTGANAIKFQTHIAEAESSKNDQFRVNFSHVDKTRYDYWKRMEFTMEQWAGLHDHAVDEGLTFLSSPFSVEAAMLLEKIGCAAWKIGSGEINNSLLLNFIGKSRKPILLSSGMSSYDEIDTAVKGIRRFGNPFVLLQCTSEYPTPLDRIGLNAMEYFSNKYGVPVGLSDHSGQIYPSLFAMARGASLIEVHVTFHKSLFGHDVQSSITVDELKSLVRGADAFYEINTNPVDKDAMALELNEMKRLFEKSVAVVEDLEKGTVLRVDMLKGLKPGTGIPVSDIEKVVKKRLKKDVKKGTLLSWGDLS